MFAQPGYVMVMGSGETAPNIRKAYQWLFERIKAPIRIALLETPAGFEPNSTYVAQQIADFLEKHLQNFKPEITIVPARKKGTHCSPDNPALLQPILAANVIMMGPGSPTYAARQLRESLAWEYIRAKHLRGAALIFTSACTIAVSSHALPVYEIYKVGEDLHWQPGLDLFGPFGLPLVFIPHWNNNDGGQALDTSHCYIGTDRYNQLVKMLPTPHTVMGIDEHTAIVFDIQAGQAQIMGASDVYQIQNGAEAVRYANGQTFALAEVGSFQPAEPPLDISAEVWQQVKEAEAVLATSAPTEAPPEVWQLVEQRTAARQRRDFAAADAIRAELAALGWKVGDTPQGPVVEPI